MVELTVAEYLKVGLKRLVAAVFYYFFPWRSFLSRLGRKAIFIVVYHRILPDGKQSVLPYISVDPKEFEKHLVFLKANFRVISLNTAVDLLARAEQLKENYVVITFDDGYSDNYDYAFPLLTRHKIPGVFYVTTGLIGSNKLLWADAVRYISYGAQLTACPSNETKPGHPKHYEFRLWKRIAEAKRDIARLKKVDEKK